MGMGCMDGFIGLGPRFIDVSARGSDVFAGVPTVFREGGVKIEGPPVFSLKIGSTLGLPFVNIVKNAAGHDIGKLNTFAGKSTLVRW